jgi:hypothetical protein
MKKLVLSAMVLVMIVSNVHAQSYYGNRKWGSDNSVCNKLYLGVSTGINNPAGIIAIDIDVPIVSHLSLGAGTGIGSWGTKYYGDLRYYLKPCNRGLAFGAGVSYSTGINPITENLATVNGNEDVTLNLKPETNLFLGVYYFWTLGKHANRIYVDAGYSIPFESVSYTETNGDALTTNADKTMKAIAPGGVMIGVGFSFGIIK